MYNGLLESSDSATIHWHGMWQRNTPHMDGTPYVSQCPIPPEQSFQYKFEAFPPGTHWYHSHIGIQRYDGIAGPLIVLPRGQRTDIPPDAIDDPENYTIFVQDWINNNTGQRQEMDMTFGFGKKKAHDQPETLLINGKGHINGREFTKDNKPIYTPSARFLAREGKRYRFRYIQGTSTACPTLVYIPGHKLDVIASDGMPIQSRTVDVLSVITGERYDFIVNFDDLSQPVPLYVVYEYNFTVFQTALIHNSRKPYPANDRSVNAPCEFFKQATEIGNELVVMNPLEDIMSKKGLFNLVNKTCHVSVNMRSVKLDQLQSADPSAFEEKSSYREILSQDFQAKDDSVVNRPIELSSSGPKYDELNLFRFQLNNISYRSPPLPGLFYDNPAGTFCNLSTIVEGNTSFTSVHGEKFYWCPHNLDLQPNKTVEFALISTKSAYIAHPLHMHGHSYAVVAMGYDISDLMSTEYLRNVTFTRNLKTPIRKDTIMVPCK